MLFRYLGLSLAAVLTLSAANPLTPVIAPNGIVNGASSFSASYVNYGIARGSLFVVYGSALGPANLTQATTFPLPTTDGLAGTRIQISLGGYTASCPIVYTSDKQVAAIMPSNAPEGDGTLVVSYQNFASTASAIHVVRSSFGIFTRNQAGTGPAIVQNFVSQTSTPLNSLITSATPGQTMILWGTGLGPVSGDETAGPLPGALSYLDSLFVGGSPVNVRYAGRSGCCVGVDQIVFDVPAGVSGCYVPVAAVTGGVVSNFGTISVDVSGKECNDALSYRATELAAGERSGVLRSGLINLAGNAAQVDYSGGFFSTDLNTALAATNRMRVPLGSCIVNVTRVGDPVPVPAGQGLNAGSALTFNGPMGQFAADNSSSGGYTGSKAGARMTEGSYTFGSTGGSDVGPWSASLNWVTPPGWTNAALYGSPSLSIGTPFNFTWAGGTSLGSVTLRIATANAIYNSTAECNVSPSAGSFTLPAFLSKALYASPATVSFVYTAPMAPFSATGLDVAAITTSLTTTAQTILTPVF